MSVYDRDDEYKLFKRRLRREARQSRPAFSDDLHARLTSALLPKRPMPRGSLPEPYEAVRGGARQSRRAAWALTAIASMATAIALALLWRAPQAARDDIVVRNTPTNTPGVVHDATGVPSWQLIPRDVATSDADDIDSMTEDLARSASGIGDWALAVADDNQWAGLDRDAQAALAAVAGPLPFDLTFSLAAE